MKQPLVAILMGSDTDYQTLQPAEEMLRSLGISFETSVLSAHRTPDEVIEFARSAQSRGLRVIIAAAGGAAALPGVVAALTLLPVLGVPIASGTLLGLDSLLSMVQMPTGVPVATFAIGTAGASNAALFAARILALEDAALRARLETQRKERASRVLQANERLRKL